MYENFKGMDPETAKKAMELIKTKKAELDREANNATTNINESISKAFAGAQTSSMQSFVTKLNEALQNLYKYLDGNDSNFATKFNEIIASYQTSDENVSSSYSTDTE